MSNSTNGYILLHKRIQDNWLWTDKPFSRGQAWIDLLMLANYEPGELLSKGTLIHIKRGQVFRSVKYFCERWGWSSKKVRNYFQTLKTDKMVTIEGLKGGTLITIENYEKYNPLGQESGTKKGKPRGKLRANEVTQNNKNKEELIKSREKFTPPTIEEVDAYCRERNNGIDPQRFIDYHEQQGWKLSNGNKMKDWKATIRTWERRNKPANTPPQRPKRTQDEIAADIAHAQGMTLEEFKRAYHYD